LEALKNQTHVESAYEVIVVDNGSTDATRAVCQRHRNRFHNFKFIFEPRPGLHIGRHIGAEAAEGELLVFTDDDTEPFPTWLEGVAESFAERDVGLSSGKSTPKFEDSPPGWVDSLRCWTEWGWYIGWYSLLDFGDRIQRIPHQFVWGCNFAVPKEIFARTKGFHPDAFPQEFIKFRGDGETALAEEIRAMGLAAVYNPKASVFHHVPRERMTLDYLSRRVFIQGISDSYTRVRQSRKPCGFLPAGHRIEGLPDALAAQYAAGFNYHQQLIRSDPELMAWVVKDHYFN
jgi:glycosyltransferase involved in cell wall biosynthesis